MTKDEFQLLLELRESYSFDLDGKSWQMFYENIGGKIKIQLGEPYGLDQVFTSFKQLFAQGRVGNHYFKDVVLSFEK